MPDADLDTEELLRQWKLTLIKLGVAGHYLEWQVARALERLQERWVPVAEALPPPGVHVWCYNADGRQFEGCMCYGMHKPFFTYPRGDGSPSNTAPGWINVTYWMALPEKPVEKKS